MSIPFGMSNHEMERELRWLLRSPPGDPQAVVKLLASAIVTIIGKNNARIAEHLANSDAPDVSEDY